MLTWTEVLRKRACATLEVYDVDGRVDGVPITDSELRELLGW